MENLIKRYENGEIEANNYRLLNMTSTINTIKIFKSFNSSDTEELNKKLALVKDYLPGVGRNLEWFLEEFVSYTTPEHIAEIRKIFDDTLQMLDLAKVERDNNKKAAAFPTAYKNVVNIFYLLVNIDNKKYENCQHKYEDTHNGVWSYGCETIRYKCKHCGHGKTEYREWTEDEYGGLSELDWRLLTDRD